MSVVAYCCAATATVNFYCLGSLFFSPCVESIWSKVMGMQVYQLT